MADADYRGSITLLDKEAPIKLVTHLVSQILLTNIPVYADNAAALSGGLVAGNIYRTNGNPDTICVVH